MIYYNHFMEDRVVMECNSMIFIINENSSFDKIRSVWNKISKKISNLSSEKKKKIIQSFIISAIAITPITGVINLILDDPESESKEEIVQVIKTMEFQDATKMKLSQNGRDMIKDHEGYRSKAYKIGDGMVTIGWGHAEPISKSKYKMGQSISTTEANMLLTDDLTKAADGVRRMFKDWNESGDYVPINQDMFDALVSLAYNSGVSGVRNSKICSKLRKKDYEGAGELIKKFKVSAKFRGLAKRREVESKLFLSFLSEYQSSGK